MENRRIVVVDDCRLHLAMFKDILEGDGHSVTTVDNGVEANQHIFSQPTPSMVIIDVEMPFLKGDRKVKIMKSQEGSKQIPVFLTSGKSDDELQRLMIESGADGYIKKPLMPADIIAKVNACIN